MQVANYVQCIRVLARQTTRLPTRFHPVVLPICRLEVNMLQERCNAAESGLASAQYDADALSADRDALQQQVRCQGHN